jgi:hypothetical protein
VNASNPTGGAWHPDPMGRYSYRWWDGSSWTTRVHDEGSTTTHDPLGMSPGTRHDPAPSTLGEASTTEVPLVIETETLGAAPPRSSIAPIPGPPVQTWAAQPPNQHLNGGVQTPNFNLPAGGAWAAPQQLVVTNASKSPGMAIASLILGVGAFFFSLIPVVGWASIPFAIVGLALGIAGAFRARKGFEGLGLSITGAVSSAAALLVSAVYIFAVGAAVDDIPDPNSDPANGVCNEARYIQDPDC